MKKCVFPTRFLFSYWVSSFLIFIFLVKERILLKKKKGRKEGIRRMDEGEFDYKRAAHGNVRSERIVQYRDCDGFIILCIYQNSRNSMQKSDTCYL